MPPVLATVLHHPRKLWLRRALFQVHLWLGVLLSLYVMVIGLSGSILVFQDEIRHASLPHGAVDEAQVAPIDDVIAKVNSVYPAWRVTFVSSPQKGSPQWAVYLEDEHGKDHTVFADALSGSLGVPQGKLFIDYVLDLHVNLLMGRTGFIVNCVAGIGLLVLSLSGVVLWWPGVKLWMRGFFLSFRRGWKRINYDAHSAIGIWTLLIVSWWGFTAVYFLLPTKVGAVVNAISPLVGMKEPAVPESPASTGVARLQDILSNPQIHSRGYLSGIALPAKPGGKVTVYVNRYSPEDFSHRDVDTFDGHTGNLLAVWHYGEKKSVGDWAVWLVYPLHFGTLWGLPIKILWACLGLSLPVLSVTGLLMYWNRYLSKRWRAL